MDLEKTPPSTETDLGSVNSVSYKKTWKLESVKNHQTL